MNTEDFGVGDRVCNRKDKSRILGTIISIRYNRIHVRWDTGPHSVNTASQLELVA